MKGAIDSGGNFVPLEDDKSPIRFIAMETRENELKTVSDKLLRCLYMYDTETDNVKFMYLIQPRYTKEQLVYFLKTELPANSKAVKRAAEYRQHPEEFRDIPDMELYKNIFCTGTGGRWYMLFAGSIEFERNYYDCKPFNAVYKEPVFYTDFLKSIEGKLMTAEDLKGREPSPLFTAVSVFDYQNEKEVISVAIERDIKNSSGELSSVLDLHISRFADEYRQDLQKDRQIWCNRACACLSTINDNVRNIYPVYEQVKSSIRKNFINAYAIRYRGNRITANVSCDRTLEIFVFGSNENPCFYMNGIPYPSLEKLNEAFRAGRTFEKNEWFSETVRPNLTIKEFKTIKDTSLSDVLGWNVKHTRNRKKRRGRKTDYNKRRRQKLKEKRKECLNYE